jgi:hypothetical protein
MITASAADPCLWIERALRRIRVGRRGPLSALVAPGSRAELVYKVAGPVGLRHVLNLTASHHDHTCRVVEQSEDEAVVELRFSGGRASTVGLTRAGTAWCIALALPFALDEVTTPAARAFARDAAWIVTDCDEPEVTRWVHAAWQAFRLLAAPHQPREVCIPSDPLSTLALYHDVCVTLLRGGARIDAFHSSLASDFFFFFHNADVGAPRVLKLLRADTPARRGGFDREIRMLLYLADCSGVPRIDEHGNVRGTPYHITRRAQGRSIEQLLQDADAWPATARARTALCLLNLVTDVHARDVVHCDIAPDHVFTTVDGAVALIDFGMACRLSELGERSATLALAQELRNVGLVLLGLIDNVAPAFGSPRTCARSWRAAWDAARARHTQTPTLRLIERALASDPECREFLPSREPYTSMAAMRADLAALLAAGCWVGTP